ncbi:MAG: hypothetical protein U0Z26_16090 [Anaerolineales bacterium]
MKTLFKILVIIVVAVLVGGLFYGAVTTLSSSSGQSTVNGQFPPDGDFARPDRDNESGGFQFPFDAVKNLIIISAVGAIYLNAGKLFTKKKLQLT